MNKIYELYDRALCRLQKWPEYSFWMIATLLALLMLFSVKAFAVEPGWYAPEDGSGQGLVVRCNDADQCAAAWLTYANGVQAWFISNENCERGQVCDVAFSRVEGQWFGESVDVLEPEVAATLEPTADSVIVDFDARQLFPERCDTGTGGLLFRNCVGAVEFLLIAR